MRKSVDTPDETRLFENGKGKLEVSNIDSGGVGRATLYGPGEFAQMALGHDAWIVGDEPRLTWQGFTDYAKR